MAARAKQAEPGKVLRIGIVQAGKVVNERLIRPGQNVSVGSGPSNTFVFEAPSLTSQHVLFHSKGGRYFLTFNDQMDGKIAHRQGIVSLSQLREQGEASRKGGQFVFGLDERNRGKIVVDDVTILFQFVNAPPESARMLTKQDFRPKLLDEDDPVFLGFLALFSSIATVVMIWAVNQEPVTSMSLEEIPDRFVDLVMPSEPSEPVEIEPQVDNNLQGPEVVQDDKPPEPSETAPTEEPAPREPQDPGDAAREEAQRLQEKKDELTRRSAVIAMLGTRGENNNGSQVEDVFAEGDGNFQSIEQALDGVSGTEIATTDNMNAVRSQTDGGGRGDAGIGDVDSTGGGSGTAVASSAPAARVPTGSISTGSIDMDDGESSDAIRKVVRAKSGQVKYCYDQRLKENPNISGRLEVEVSISGGRVTSVSILENSTGDSVLESCAQRKIRSWRFPADVENTIYLPFALEAN
jgi:hypothetical protein